MIDYEYDIIDCIRQRHGIDILSLSQLNRQMNLVETWLISWSLSLRRRVERQEKTWHCTRHRCSLSRYFCFTIYASPSQDDHRGFRRQLEDKRPVVENNLLSGRQYIANEPPLSDTSDSEGTLWITHKSRSFVFF